MIALTKWLGGTWEESGYGFWGMSCGSDFDKPRTEQTLIDPAMIQGVEPWEPWEAGHTKGTPPECCKVFLKTGKSFKVVGNYKEIAKLAGVSWKCQYCDTTNESCPNCGAPKPL